MPDVEADSSCLMIKKHFLFTAAILFLVGIVCNVHLIISEETPPSQAYYLYLRAVSSACSAMALVLATLLFIFEKDQGIFILMRVASLGFSSVCTGIYSFFIHESKTVTAWQVAIVACMSVGGVLSSVWLQVLTRRRRRETDSNTDTQDSQPIMSNHERSSSTTTSKVPSKNSSDKTKKCATKHYKSGRKNSQTQTGLSMLVNLLGKKGKITRLYVDVQKLVLFGYLSGEFALEFDHRGDMVFNWEIRKRKMKFLFYLIFLDIVPGKTSARRRSSTAAAAAAIATNTMRRASQPFRRKAGKVGANIAPGGASSFSCVRGINTAKTRPAKISNNMSSHTKIRVVGPGTSASSVDKKTMMARKRRTSHDTEYSGMNVDGYCCVVETQQKGSSSSVGPSVTDIDDGLVSVEAGGGRGPSSKKVMLGWRKWLSPSTMDQQPYRLQP